MVNYLMFSANTSICLFRYHRILMGSRIVGSLTVLSKQIITWFIPLCPSSGLFGILLVFQVNFFCDVYLEFSLQIKYMQYDEYGVMQKKTYIQLLGYIKCNKRCYM